ncbi:hypothetical protein NDU88_012834 [Pleurodeles waltl]|uniref:Neural proliferation differentiation and control protein 1 n=1 Tax=Pleurodeles waltl TaxID=8319 RepID=A0AAV7R733_PLEWA|nr:hypothetical protein NDU88_012834 [Pleurodeles waltl]
MQLERGPLDCLGPACLLALMLLIDGSTADLPQCPSRLSCLLDRRYPCTPGSRECGPCLAKYQEDPGGKCTPKRPRTQVSKENPKEPDPEKVIDLIGNLLKSSKGSQPEGHKTSRVGWAGYVEEVKTPTGRLKTSVGSLKASREHLRTHPEELKASVAGMKASLEHRRPQLEGLKTSLGGDKTNPTLQRTHPERLKTLVGALKTPLDLPRTHPDALKSSAPSRKTPLEQLKASLAGLRNSGRVVKTPLVLAQQNNISEETKVSVEGRKAYLEGSNHTTGVALVLVSAKATDGLPTWQPTEETTTRFNTTTAVGATHSPEILPPARQEGAVKAPQKAAPENLNDAVSLTLVVICTLTGISGLLVAALCWYRLQKEVRLAQKMAYTAYRGSQRYPGQQPGDTRLAQSVQVHHYQHQKKHLQHQDENALKAQQQLSTESEAENEGGEYTVYECPGLAPTGEMEIHNPLFFDSSALHAAPGRLK